MPQRRKDSGYLSPSLVDEDDEDKENYFRFNLSEARLINDHDEVLRHYNQMFSKLCKSFQMRKLSVLKVRTQFNNLQLPEVADEHNPKLDTIEECFHHLSKHSSWFNTRVLEALVDEDGCKKDKDLLQNYLDQRENFLDHSIDMIPNSYGPTGDTTCPKEQRMVLKLPEPVSFTGKDLHRMAALVFKKFGIHAELLSIRKGCLELIFKVFVHANNFKLTEVLEQFLKQHRVLRLSIGERVYYSASTEELTKVR